NYFKQIKPNNAKAGDVVIVNVGGGLGNNGHTAILLEDWHGKDTDIVQIGGVDDKVNKDKFGTSFTSLLSGDTTLARPIEK
ncbi:MAG: peptidoglycan hydrolase, partial [Tetragenococcus koreensis]|nr:peptidoglycan hydrolase [Tetragenococcus koreensis]